MNIIINGCGKIGTTILSNLVNEGHDITIIDTSPEVIQKLTNIYDVIGVCGNGIDSDVLKEANIESQDLLISTAESDETNMLTCFFAKKLGVKNTIARIRNPEYNDKGLSFIRNQLDISLTINPELMTSAEIFNMLRLPPAAKLINFSVKNFEIIEFKIKDDSILNGLKVSEIRNKFKSKFLVCAVQRGNEAYIPDGNFILNAGDKIGVTASANEINKMFKELNMKKTSAKKVMIYGGSKTAVFLAKQLSDADINVTIIEKDKEKCQKLIDDLPKCTIICGDCSSHELLIEEGLTETDAVIALTNMDELNVLMSSYATSQGTTTVITKINKQELIPISEHWGLDAIVSPQKSVANTIVRYARALKNSRGSNIETLYKLMDNKVEAIEFTAKKDSEILNIPLKDLQLKQNILIAGIVRNRKNIIPTGSDMMLSGDKIIVLCAGHCINDLSDIVR